MPGSSIWVSAALVFAVRCSSSDETAGAADKPPPNQYEAALVSAEAQLSKAEADVEQAEGWQQ